MKALRFFIVLVAINSVCLSVGFSAQAARRFVFASDITSSSVRVLVDRIQNVRANGETDITVVLNSNGGDLIAALDGYSWLKAANIKTEVQDTCDSACILLFAAGTTRKASSAATFDMVPIAVSRASNRDFPASIRNDYVREFAARWLHELKPIAPKFAIDLKDRRTLTDGEPCEYTSRQLFELGLVTGGIGVDFTEPEITQ